MSNNLTPHPTWEIHDASKLQMYMECPRKYFYRYILGWKPDVPNVNLVFGEAWHRAMEHILLNGKSNNSIADAYKKFEDYYRKYFPDPYTDETRGVKTPGNALAGIVEYCENYKHDSFEVIETEVAGTVPIDANYMFERMHFRIDAVCKGEHGYFILEHKTSKRESEAWKNQWILSTQVNLYSHALFCLYPNDVWGALVNGVIFRKRDRGFVRVPIRKTLPGINNWMIQTQHWYHTLKRDIDKLKLESPDSPAMRQFPMNTQSCTRYYRTCPYHDFCLSWANPLKRCQEGCPEGLVIDWWNPADKDREVARRVVDL